MDKNFIQYQASAVKELIGLLEYQFTSDSNTYSLIELVKNQILSKREYRPNLNQILSAKSTSDKEWFKTNIPAEYVDVLFEADNHQEVYKSFVLLYNSYIIYSNASGDDIIKTSYYNNFDISFKDYDSILDTANIDLVYNPELTESVSMRNEIDADLYEFDRMKDIVYLLQNNISYYITIDENRNDDSENIYPIIDKDRDSVFVSEPLKSIIFNQPKLRGVIPLDGTFQFNPEDINKQVQVSARAELLNTGDWKNELFLQETITENIGVFNDVNKLRQEVKAKTNASYGTYYIDQINKMSLIKSKYKFYALASLKDEFSYIDTSVNIIFNKERTISALVDGYDFYYTIMMMCKCDSESTFDIFYDEENQNIVFLGGKKVSVRTPSGYNPSTMQIEYSLVDVFLTMVLPIKKEQGKVIDEVWAFAYSLSTSLKDVLEFSKDTEEISKIKIPSEFLNQKEIISKEQAFKIETVEEKIFNTKATGKDLLDKVVSYIEDYRLTYSERKQVPILDSNGAVVGSRDIYEPITNEKRFFLQGTQINYDYIWKVNETFWRYNQNISVPEMIAYFIAKGDDYYYRLLSYRILGVDCHLFRDLLIVPLLKEGSLCIEDFEINIATKSIETPIKFSYKYEYATGNFYEKRKKLSVNPDLDTLSVYPMRESIMLYYGDDLGENIVQNQISFLQDELVKPSEMTWNSKSEKTKLFTSPLDPIFLKNDTQNIRDKFGSSQLVVKQFYDFLGSARFTNDQVTRRDLLFGYILRLPESVSIPLQFINDFNCYKIAILPKENPDNTVGVDVFAVYGTNDTLNKQPLFKGSDAVNSQPCKDYIKSKQFGGSIKFRRRTKVSKKYGVEDLGTYAFNKTLKYLEASSYRNLWEGGFISDEEKDNFTIDIKNRKKIVSEILIAFNTKQPKVVIEGDIQFNKFMSTKVDDLDALKMQRIWNQDYNYFMYPKQAVSVEGFDDIVLKLDNSKFPIFVEHSRFFKDTNSQEFLLNDNQVDGIKFHIGNNSSSLLAHEVGFGKTTTAICSLTHNFLTGKAKRTMISVPNPTYINWISEMKGQTLADKKLRGLIPHINIVELKNARKDVFLKYDEKTFTQTGGIKKYTKSQIEIIHNFSDATNVVVKEIEKRVKSIYFTDFDTKKENYDSLIKFIEKTFDSKLVGWRSEAFFTEYFDQLNLIQREYSQQFDSKIDSEKELEDASIERINDNLNYTQKVKDEKIAKEREKYKKRKTKVFELSTKDFTSDILGIIKSKKNAIFDVIGVYEDYFMRQYSVVICTHEAVGQLRVNRYIADEVSEELKDDTSFATELLNNAIGFDKLDIDSVVVDEVHNFNELFAYSKRQISQLVPKDRQKTYFLKSDYNLSVLKGISNLRYKKKARGTNLSSVVKFNITAGSTSPKKASLFGICKTLQNKSKGKTPINIMLLSATPFVDNLFQMIGVFNMLRPFPLPIDFFSNYLYQEWDWENDHKGETVLKVQTSNFKNHDARNNWIRLYSQFYTFDQRINAKRPEKFVYPYDCKGATNQYEDNCNSNVYLDFSKEQYDIYKNIGKYVDGSIGRDVIVKSILNTVSITKEVYIDSDDIVTVKDLIDKSSPSHDLEQATTIFIHNNWIDVLLDSKNEYNKDIVEIYDVIKEQYDLMTSDEEDEESVSADGEQVVQDINDESEISGNGINDAGTRALQAQDLGKKLSLSPYMVSPDKAKDGYINPTLPPLYGMNNEENMLKSAINFVETSPKIYFCVKAIECLINKHNDNQEDITGQIIYMAWGQSFWYGGYRYNGMELIKSYLKNKLDLNKKFTIEESDELSKASGEKANIKKYDLDEVQNVSGASQDALKKSAISKAFNSGKIKVLIGSGTIKEGINLQGEGTHGNSTIYVLTAEYAPMAMMQLEGRIWRQGNPLKNVRMVYPLIKNSIDSHIYSKLSEKIKKVKNMLEAGIYDFKQTQFDKDIEGVSLALNTNIEEKIKIMWGKETRSITKETAKFDSFKTRVEVVKKKYSDCIVALDDLVTIFNPVSKALQDYYVGGFIRQDYKVSSGLIRDRFRAKRADIVEKLNKAYQSDVAEWERLKDENEALNKENEKLNKANDKLIKAGKSKKIAKIDFVLDKPLKKEDKYQPDYTLIDSEEEMAFEKAKQEAIDINTKKVDDGVFTNDDITYYTPISASMPYSEVSAIVNKTLSQLSVIPVSVYTDNELIVLKGRITVSGYYWVLESKSMTIDFNFTETLKANPMISSRMSKAIKTFNMGESLSGGIQLFKDFCRIFVGGGGVESVLSDYQALVIGEGKTISNIDDIINGFETEIRNYNDKLNQKEQFFVKYRKVFIEQEERIKKERELLTNMQQYVLLDVNKFCQTNKFIYLKGKYTAEEEKSMFQNKI